MYNDDDIEAIELFTQRLIDLLKLYKQNKESRLLYDLINENAYNITTYLKC